MTTYEVTQIKPNVFAVTYGDVYIGSSTTYVGAWRLAVIDHQRNQ